MQIEPRFHKIEKIGPVIIWKFHNPPQNLATSETFIELIILIEAFDKDPELRVGIVTSAMPGMFIQHFDVSELVVWGESLKEATAEDIDRVIADLPPKSMGDYTEKPIICAINGPVEGGGCEMALGCDFRFISRDAFMGQPEVWSGFPPGSGGMQYLARLVGTERAMELCMTGRNITAEEAERLGLVTAACEPDDLMPRVMAFANDLAAKPPLAIANIKKAITRGSSMPLQEALVLERKLFLECLRSDDAMNFMRLYVAAGQDAEKMMAMLEEAGQDPEKLAQLIAENGEMNNDG